MTGFESKRRVAQDKLNDDDDIQVYKRPWVDLTEDQIKTIEENALTKQWAIRMTIAQLKECNA